MEQRHAEKLAQAQQGSNVSAGLSCLCWAPSALLSSSQAPAAAGLVLPLLGGLPDALIVGVSAFASSREAAQEEVAVGIGALAGPSLLFFSCKLPFNGWHCTLILCLPLSVSWACPIDALMEPSTAANTKRLLPQVLPAFLSVQSLCPACCCDGRLTWQDFIRQPSSAWHA